MAGIIKVDQLQSDSNLAFNIAGSNVAFLDSSSMRMVSSNLSLAGTNVIQSGKVLRTGMPSGSILQVQQTLLTDTFSTTSTTFVDVTGLSVSITPTSASSRFLVMTTIIAGSNWWSTAGGYFAVLCNGTQVAGSGSAVWVYQYGADAGNSPNETVQWTDSALHSPATTSALTYQVRVASSSGSSALFVNRNASGSSSPAPRSFLTVMEIAG